MQALTIMILGLSVEEQGQTETWLLHKWETSQVLFLIKTTS